MVSLAHVYAHTLPHHSPKLMKTYFLCHTFTQSYIKIAYFNNGKNTFQERSRILLRFFSSHYSCSLSHATTSPGSTAEQRLGAILPDSQLKRRN